MASSYRFFNRNIRPIYSACPLPALRPPNDVTPVQPHILQAEAYHRQELKRSLHCPWKHTRYKPPRPWIRAAGVPPLSRPFNAFHPTETQTKKKKSGTKRKKKLRWSVMNKKEVLEGVATQAKRLQRFKEGSTAS